MPLPQDVPRRHWIAVSAFIAFIVVLLLSVLIFMGVPQKLLSPKAQLYVAFRESVSGLDVGAPVTFCGVKVGEVTDVEPMMDADADQHVRQAAWVVDPNLDENQAHDRGAKGKELSGTWTDVAKEEKTGTSGAPTRPLILVTIAIKNDRLKDLNRSSSAVLELLNITGNNAIRLETKDSKPTRAKLKEGDVIVAGRSPFADFTESLLGKDGILAAENRHNLRDLIDNARALSTVLNQVATDGQGDLREILAAYREVGQRLRDLLKQDGDGAHLASAIENMDDVSKKLKAWTDTEGEITCLLRELRGVAKAAEPLLKAPSTPDERGNVVSLVGTTQDLANTLNELVKQLKALTGSVDMMVAENRERLAQVLENTDRLTRRINNLAAQIDEDPGSLLQGRKGDLGGADGK